MDALRFNKIAAALLSGVLLIMVFGKIGNILVNPKTEISNAYPIEVPEKNETKSKVAEEVIIDIRDSNSSNDSNEYSTARSIMNMPLIN